jgi:DNA-binding CsgD family transcriptional regulator
MRLHGATNMRISKRDFDLLQSTILELHAFRDIVAFRRNLSATLLKVIRADYCVLSDLRVLADQRRIQLLDVWESGRRVQTLDPDSYARVLFEHPFTQHAIRHGDTGAMLLSDFLTLAQLRRTELYRVLLRPSNVGRVLAVGTYGGPALASLSFSRPERARDFSERDRRMLNLLRPHFEQARANLERETASRATRSDVMRTSGLTPRETEIAVWLAKGKSNQEIAAILGAPVRTVEKHVERILAKLGVENRAAAAVTIVAAIRP